MAHIPATQNANVQLWSLSLDPSRESELACLEYGGFGHWLVVFLITCLLLQWPSFNGGPGWQQCVSVFSSS